MWDEFFYRSAWSDIRRVGRRLWRRRRWVERSYWKEDGHGTMDNSDGPSDSRAGNDGMCGASDGPNESSRPEHADKDVGGVFGCGGKRGRGEGSADSCGDNATFLGIGGRLRRVYGNGPPSLPGDRQTVSGETPNGQMGRSGEGGSIANGTRKSEIQNQRQSSEC